MAEEGSGEFEPVYLTLADVLELHALIIGATAPRRPTSCVIALAWRARSHGRKPMPTTRTQTWCSRPPSWRTGFPGGPAVHRRHQAHGADCHARLPRDQRLARRSLRPQTGRLDSQLQPGCDARDGRQAPDLRDAQHLIAAGPSARATDAASMGPQRTAVETPLLSGRHAPEDDP